ncbi:MAG: transcriptional repressor [Desulfobacter sp.]|nr:transcriptional repressor [Desulfobacter sp.]WDP84137.1 MAG: transcriptional repressor [Desulfobacter sp.]
MNTFYEQCKANHLKITPQRVAVYKALSSSLSHPSTDQIHRELKKDFPNISLDTVNRTLISFAKANLIDVVEGHGDPRRYDPNQESHHHFYCVSCRKIFDIHDNSLDCLTLSPEIEKKFTITGKRLCLTGFCDQCRSPQKKAAEKSTG